ncbi:Predicted membrane protein (plasmid) [Tsukamurella tyrosinosolvens]|uniref:Uncharacterized protein n=1 Tax=Tsukamurella tyrosinosolvens TaxID=57704 RepID=A0A1H4P7B4_TSUTY|nr:DUF418 domain-containing protein [Tsukamurella tyrosinosolvens]KXO97288.1 hypothetical protein AXK58_08670 [Tsukamurella tyrosinosolvens]RDB45246.1 DUF418 domain-containing protein [Tsukamurella tyrosinosolvens]SEC03341.1 uncharacterized protein SAMN04489793_1363 [Tsukamurella tyrosinosolvens]VEH99855.1 Predicted membrane protein [Tsukamurella tyrosinosolvens]
MSTITEAGTRIAPLDALRGFALGGIFVVNIGLMADPEGFGPGVVRDLVDVLFHHKFYVLFSFLFGYSLTLQFRSAQRDGASARARTARRLAALAVIGALHAVLLFTGDVLFGYGVIGIALLALSRIRPRSALRLATALYAGCLLLLTGLTVARVVTAPAEPGHAAALDAIRAGWGRAAAYRFDYWFSGLAPMVVFGLLNVLPLFLVGLAAGKVRLLEDPARYLPHLPRVQAIGFGLGLPIAAIPVLLRIPNTEALGYLSGPLLAAAYAATFLRIIHARPAVSAAFAPAGRISATVYLSQSLIAAIVFTGYGFAQAGMCSDGAVLAFAVGVFALQLVAARWYTERFRYGPVEWVLRVATYGGTGRMRAHARATVSGPA